MTGALISWFLIPDRSRDLASEDDEFRMYLAANGYVGKFGEKGSDARVVIVESPHEES